MGSPHLLSGKNDERNRKHGRPDDGHARSARRGLILHTILLDQHLDPLEQGAFCGVGLVGVVDLAHVAFALGSYGSFLDDISHPLKDVRRILRWIHVPHDGAHVERDDVVLGEPLLVPRVRSLPLGVVHLLVLYCLELHQKVLHFGVRHEGIPILVRVDPIIGILPELEQFCVGQVPVKGGASPRLGVSDSLGTAEEINTAVLGVLAVVRGVRGGTFGDRPSTRKAFESSNVVRPEHGGLIGVRGVGRDARCVGGRAVVADLRVSGDVHRLLLEVEESGEVPDPVERGDVGPFLGGRDRNDALILLVGAPRPAEDEGVGIVADPTRDHHLRHGRIVGIVQDLHGTVVHHLIEARRADVRGIAGVRLDLRAEPEELEGGKLRSLSRGDSARVRDGDGDVMIILDGVRRWVRSALVQDVGLVVVLVVDDLVALVVGDGEVIRRRVRDVLFREVIDVRVELAGL
mmetsp:Transcript_53133/g.159011  ORF Transcript_53133/g.159011 Transcript_53133/m.159011 type:complete len:461 (+) Transcript_53133:91-1473(+)